MVMLHAYGIPFSSGLFGGKLPFKLNAVPNSRVCALNQLNCAADEHYYMLR